MKKFIITDPCYIIAEDLWQDVCFDIESRVPFKIRSGKGTEITIHECKGTPNGDGSYTFRGERIGVDAGLLCIAECEQGWDDDGAFRPFGAKFASKEAAEKNFEAILSHF